MEFGIKLGKHALKSNYGYVSFITEKSENRYYLSQECGQKSTIAGSEKWERLAEVRWNPHCSTLVPIKFSGTGLQVSMMWVLLTQDRIISHDESHSWERICVGFENSFGVSAKQHLILKKNIII